MYYFYIPGLYQISCGILNHLQANYLANDLFCFRNWELETSGGYQSRHHDTSRTRDCYYIESRPKIYSLLVCIEKEITGARRRRCSLLPRLPTLSGM